jgi:aminoglycoside 6'-N-acetyltransferase I
VTTADRQEYLRMRCLLYSGDDPALIERELDDVLRGDPADTAVFVFDRSGGSLGAFLEIESRWAGVEGAMVSVAFVGSWYVEADLRRQGVGTALLRAAEDWARVRGCTALESDCYETNEVSHRAHLAAGFQEIHRAILFRKPL